MPSPSPKPTMKERILETADRLFYLRGIRAVGVDTIAAEIGISNQKLHCRGPFALEELTSTKYEITGTGQVRG